MAIAYPAIDDEPGDAAVLGGDGEDLAPMTMGAALQIDDQHAARWSLQNGVMQGEVVTCAPADRVSPRGDSGAVPYRT